MLQEIKCIQSNDPKLLQQAYSDLWNAIENGDFQNDPETFFTHRARFRELMMIDPSQPVTWEPYVIRRDSFTDTVRGIALIFKDDKETILGSWNEKTGDFTGMDNVTFDINDIVQIFEVDRRITQQGFDAIFNMALPATNN